MMIVNDIQKPRVKAEKITRKQNDLIVEAKRSISNAQTLITDGKDLNGAMIELNTAFGLLVTLQR